MRVLILLALAGCTASLPPPTQEVPAAFASPGAPGEVGAADWFATWRDPALTELQALARARNPDLRTAAATVAQARAVEGGSQLALLPSVTARASSTASEAARVTSSSLDASWEVDLFGHGLAAARADRRSAEAALAGADVSLMAEVADSYVQYRACRASEAILADVLTSQQETLKATAVLAASGLSRPADAALAEAGVSSAKMSLESQRASCRVLAQGLTVLTGSVQAQVDAVLARGQGLPSAPALRVTSVPADALRQRPDVAAAEADFAAAMARVGTARTAFLPTLTLSGSVGKTWSFGPALSLPLFTQGASVAQAEAKAAMAGEAWRKAVLSAVAEIEGALTEGSSERRNAAEAARAVKGYADYFAALDTNWKAGGETLLNREQAARNWQSARLTEVTHKEQALRQMIALYKAVGGGWQRESAE